MTAFDVATVRCTVWQLTLLARLIARHPLPWVLAQDVVPLQPQERRDLVDLLGAWHVGMRLRQRGESARAP